MKIFSAENIRNWDQYTIQHEPIASIDLMERAATACSEWIVQHCNTQEITHIFCAKGNNGGDGLAIARLLFQQGQQVIVYILEFGHKGTDDFQANLARLHQYPEITIRYIQAAEHFPSLTKNDLLIDALFGSGLNRPLDGITRELVQHLNKAQHDGSTMISIDIPSGMFTDRSSTGNEIIHADHTLSFQVMKPAFLFAENLRYSGELHLLDIGLHPDFYQNTAADYELIDAGLIKTIYKPREASGHKGTYGHALIIAGSYGKMGAAILCGRACLRSGVGLLTYHIPQGGYDIMQTSVPEAMVMTDFNKSFVTEIQTELSKYTTIGIGPGIGTAKETASMLNNLLENYRKPVVIDADGLNNLSQHNNLLHKLAAGSILTPHPKEFDRLFGASIDESSRIQTARQKAKELQVVIVLKGHHTLIALPDGKAYFNSTGNAGMATGGSGDVLTGILTGLLAQGYSSAQAAILGVYIHGLAGDHAAAELSKEAMIAGDIVNYLGAAFLSI